MLNAELKRAIREVPNFPKPGINFYDVTTLFRDARAYQSATDRLIERYRGDRVDAVAGIEARGFVLASTLAHALGVGLILIRKPGKLPAETIEESYSLEYGENRLEMHKDAVESGQSVLVVDDLLATGGTAVAAGKLLERCGAELTGFAFLIELKGLNGREALGDRNVFAMLQYDD